MRTLDNLCKLLSVRVDKWTCVVIGAGVVKVSQVAAGIAASGREVIVLEQHELIGRGRNSSRNSTGIIHAGIVNEQS